MSTLTVQSYTVGGTIIHQKEEWLPYFEAKKMQSLRLYTDSDGLRAVPLVLLFDIPRSYPASSILRG